MEVLQLLNLVVGHRVVVRMFGVFSWVGTVSLF